MIIIAVGRDSPLSGKQFSETNSSKQDVATLGEQQVSGNQFSETHFSEKNIAGIEVAKVM